MCFDSFSPSLAFPILMARLLFPSSNDRFSEAPSAAELPSHVTIQPVFVWFLFCPPHSTASRQSSFIVLPAFLQLSWFLTQIFNAVPNFLPLMGERGAVCQSYHIFSPVCMSPLSFSQSVEVLSPRRQQLVRSPAYPLRPSFRPYSGASLT